MAFSSVVKKQDIQGTSKKVYCSFDAAGVTGGVIETGLAEILHVNLSNQGAAAAGAKALFAGGTVTLSGLTANDVGTLEVIGF